MERPSDSSVNISDVFRNVDTNMEAPLTVHQSGPRSVQKEGGMSLGIDEEIKVAKKRRPVVKLDEDRLLSQAGIPKLRRIAKERLKFKGKGHEYTDIARLLSFYQLWLDDLFPRAKFADGLTIIEKLGHSKRMQTMRKEWINEGKPREENTIGDNIDPDAQFTERQREHDLEDTIPFVSTEKELEPALDDGPHPDPAKGPSHGTRNNVTVLLDNEGHGESLFLTDEEDGNQPQGDDLDALLAEDTHNRRNKPEEFEDELEIMHGMEDLW